MVVACCSHKTLPFATCKCVDYNGKIEFYDLSAMLRVRVNTESRKKMGTIRVTMCKGGFFYSGQILRGTAGNHIYPIG